jgi:E3 ubiquitin-protein ligase SHPRH
MDGVQISHGLEDLYGLMMFLRVSPWGTSRWWKHHMQGPCERGSSAALADLVDLLSPRAGGLMWRNSKRDVAEEIGIPPQVRET